MSNKLAHLETLLTNLSKERMELDAAIEQVMANMAEVPAEKRSASDWASDGVPKLCHCPWRSQPRKAETAALARSRSFPIQNEQKHE
jgi:hypothetical protein